MIKISLCICTRNRHEELRNCLTAIYQGNVHPFEVIVSDDSDEEAPAHSLTAEFEAAIYQRGPCKGLGPNRNACIRRSTGTHIMFIDDDVRVSPHFFETAYSILQEEDAHTVVTGCQTDHTETTTYKITPHNVDFWGFQQVAVRDEYRSIVINATVFPASLFNKAVFDENVRYGSEEIDMARHAVALGFKIVFRDSLCVDHFPSPINRMENNKYVEASRLYVSVKAYWQYEHSPLKTIIFIFLAPLQMIGSAARKRDWSRMKCNVRSVLLASQYLCRSIMKARFF